ncbi:MAG: hypothetical protein DRN04_16550, partial [Thermoprotei archaeon]
MYRYDNESTKRRRYILIVTRSSRKEIMNPSFGGSRLVKEIYERLVMKSFKVYILSLHDISSIAAYFLRIKTKVNSVSRTKIKNERLKWILNLLYNLLTELLSWIDIKLRKEAAKKIEKLKVGAIIYNGSIGAFAFLKVARARTIPFILCEHNIDYYFYEDKIGCNLLIKIYKVFELLSAKASDTVICFNSRDKERLVKNGIPSEKIFLMEFNVQAKKRYSKKEALN